MATETITLSANETLNSYEFWKQLNVFRTEAGEREIENGDFLARVLDECEISNSEIFRVRNDRGNREVNAVNLDKDQMLLVGMRESKVVRKKVLGWLKELTKEDEFKLPQTFGEALRLAAEQQERIEAQQALLTEQAPKVEYHDTVLDTSNTFPISVIAKDLGMSAVKLNRRLYELGIQYNLNGVWMLYAEHQDKDWTRMSTRLITRSSGIRETRHHMSWTEKGREAIMRLFS